MAKPPILFLIATGYHHLLPRADDLDSMWAHSCMLGMRILNESPILFRIPMPD
jgi:hypothetical protein